MMMLLFRGRSREGCPSEETICLEDSFGLGDLLGCEDSPGLLLLGVLFLLLRLRLRLRLSCSLALTLITSFPDKIELIIRLKKSREYDISPLSIQTRHLHRSHGGIVQS